MQALGDEGEGRPAGRLPAQRGVGYLLRVVSHHRRAEDQAVVDRVHLVDLEDRGVAVGHVHAIGHAPGTGARRVHGHEVARCEVVRTEVRALHVVLDVGRSLAHVPHVVDGLRVRVRRAVAVVDRLDHRHLLDDGSHVEQRCIPTLHEQEALVGDHVEVHDRAVAQGGEPLDVLAVQVVEHGVVHARRGDHQVQVGPRDRVGVVAEVLQRPLGTHRELQLDIAQHLGVERVAGVGRQLRHTGRVAGIGVDCAHGQERVARQLLHGAHDRVVEVDAQDALDEAARASVSPHVH